ncbi:hypothetical protein E4U42_006507 [Claviceps africana]|uniref:tRNA-splicing endonuclease subunit Sen34 n=1 Tax=Claviceps africana TaxID=83212 RepID=A0A8K0JBQ0_9HYPO|nr:hypothetical protein E4U42_006507 [Claviceps africana]
MSLVVDEFKSHETIRIAKIAGRYLVFDPDAVAFLRRCEHINGTLVGTTPQQPTQNVFLGLPVELRPEEVDILLHKKSAHVVDDADAHNAALQADRNAAFRRRYIASLRNNKQAARYTLSQKSASKTTGKVVCLESNCQDVNSPHPERRDESHIMSMEGKPINRENQSASVGPLAVTPVSSVTLVASASEPNAAFRAVNPTLCDLLKSRGHYTTPGLRFGSRYSVYPGDPLRFHAHFMANEYYWEEQIPILDIVGGGRLATAVKKAFLIGGHDASKGSDLDSIQTYSIEWAAM